jgi:hypothetical protein
MTKAPRDGGSVEDRSDSANNADLPPGWSAWRDYVGGEWSRKPWNPD